MKKQHSLIIFTFIFFFLFSPTNAASKRCSQCNIRLTGSYLKDSKNNLYCSQKCFKKILPHCATCGKTIQGKHLSSGKKHFCSKKCFEAILPKCALCKKPIQQATVFQGKKYCKQCFALPRCAICQHPFINGVELSDSRKICDLCRSTGIYNQEKAKKLYLQANTILKNITNIRPKNIPLFLLANLQLISEKHPNKQASLYSLRGFYHVKIKIDKTLNNKGIVLKSKTTKNETIYIISGLNKEAFLATATHELTHDFIEEFYPDLNKAPLWVEEGLCQFTASLMCRKLKFKKQYLIIKNCPDEIYGKGFKWFVKKFPKRNWANIQHWLENKKYLKLK